MWPTTADVGVSIIFSSVANFLVLGGGGGQAPQMYRQKKKNVHVTYARAASERLRNTFIGLYFQVLKYICIYNQCSSLLLKYGMAL